MNAPECHLTLVEYGNRKYLAGHSDDSEQVYVLRKEFGNWVLYRMPVSEAEQSLRSIAPSGVSESSEVLKAIYKTGASPGRKPRRRKAK